MTEPMIEFDIDVSEIVRLAQAVPVLEQAIIEELENGLEESGMLLTGLTQARTPVNYGMLRSAIQWPYGFELQGNVLDMLRGVIGADAVTGVGTVTSEYVWYVEEGTDPHWAPIGPLKLWAIRKLGDERAAYAVQRAIAKRGTEGAHMFRRAWEQGGKRGVERIMGSVTVRAVRRFVEAAS